jgi:predicted esterase
MNEHHIAVRRTARFYTLGDANASDVWIVCHGYAQLARYFLRPFTGIDDGARLIVAPEALNRYYSESRPGVHGPDARIGATWMTREDREHEITDYIAYLDTLAAAVAPPAARLVVLGFSQGAATVSRWCARGRTRIDELVLWGTGPAHDIDLAPGRFGDARLTLAAGSQDTYFDPAAARALQTRLDAVGIPADVFAYDGGHRIEPGALVELAARIRDRAR